LITEPDSVALDGTATHAKLVSRMPVSQKQLVSGRFARPVWFSVSPVVRLLAKLFGRWDFGQAIKGTLGGSFTNSEFPSNLIP
jgi:hypothetical protein